MHQDFRPDNESTPPPSSAPCVQSCQVVQTDKPDGAAKAAAVDKPGAEADAATYVIGDACCLPSLALPTDLVLRTFNADSQCL